MVLLDRGLEQRLQVRGAVLVEIAAGAQERRELGEERGLGRVRIVVSGDEPVGGLAEPVDERGERVDVRAVSVREAGVRRRAEAALGTADSGSLPYAYYGDPPGITMAEGWPSLPTTSPTGDGPAIALPPHPLPSADHAASTART